jgi:hypothetical protein
MFGSKREEVAGGWRRLHNEELYNLYASQNIIREIKSRIMRLAAHVARMGETRNAYNILIGKPECKRQLGRPRCRWEDIRMDSRELGWEVVDWIHLAFVNTVMNLRAPEKVRNFLTS